MKQQIFRKSTFLFILITINIIGQNKNCDVTTIRNGNITLVESADVRCLAKNTTKNKILLFSFGMWCAPCIKHLPDAIKLSQDHNLELFVLLIDREDESELLERSIKYLNNKKSDLNILLLKDYKNKKRTAKYIKFLNEITPEKFENLNDMSKYIVFNKKGEVIMVTNWKDSRKYDSEDDSEMIEHIIVPILNESY